MATWNRAAFIEKAIESVREQTFSHWELLIADDGSTDATPSIATKWQALDSRIRYLPLGHIGKIAAVSNAALREAKGEFVAILDDDDWWRDPRKLEKQVAFLRLHPDYVACGGGLIVVDEQGKETSKVLKPETDTSIRKVALVANPIANSTSLFRRAVAGYYKESLVQLADWDFWLTIGTKGKLYNFPEYFLSYRVWRASISFVRQREHAAVSLQIIRAHRNEYPNFWKALAITCLYLLYVRLPLFIRTRLNAFLSGLKKKFFSR